MRAEELENAVVKALVENGSDEIAVWVEPPMPEIPGEGQCFHIRLNGDIFMDDLNTVVEVTGDKNIIIDGHPLGGLDIFCCIKSNPD